MTILYICTVYKSVLSEEQAGQARRDAAGARANRQQPAAVPWPANYGPLARGPRAALAGWRG